MPEKTLKDRVAALEAEMRVLKDQFEVMQVREGIRRGREQAAQGRVVDAREFLEAMRKKYKLSRA